MMSTNKTEMPAERAGRVDRRSLLHMAAGAVAGAAVAGGMPEVSVAKGRDARHANHRGGHLYMQTNESRNAIVHYRRSSSGALAEVERVSTGGAGSGLLSPLYQVTRPNDLEGAGSVILTPDRQFLLTTNAGDNSVSSFRVGEGGQLTLADVKPTGNPVNGTSGTAKSLAFAPSASTVFVGHAFGPDHVRLMSIDRDGKLTARPERYTVNTKGKTGRVITMVRLSPDGKFLLVGIIFDELPNKNPDGSPILWVRRPDGTLKSVIGNASDPDGLVVLAVQEDGSLGSPSFHDAGGPVPFYTAFLNSRPDTFVLGYAVGDGCAICTLDENGKIDVGPLVKIDTSAGVPSELCWLAVSPDDRTVYTTNFGYGTISSYRINGNKLSIAKDPACPKVPGDGTFRAFDSTVSSGPSDSWITPDGAYLYQIYGNALKLVGYATQPDGSLSEITSVKIPYNSPQGLAGF
jgi:6-phosphogluconolactonase (cycloisomerase 2 family)